MRLDHLDIYFLGYTSCLSCFLAPSKRHSEVPGTPSVVDSSGPLSSLSPLTYFDSVNRCGPGKSSFKELDGAHVRARVNPWFIFVAEFYGLWMFMVDITIVFMGIISWFIFTN